MKNDPTFEIFRRAFSSRVEVALAIKNSLEAPTENLDRLKAAIPKLEAAVAELGDGDAEDQYRAYWTASSVFAVLAEWKHALRNAEPDAGRFLSSAKIKSCEIDTVSTFGGNERLASFLEFVAAIDDVRRLQVLTDHLDRWQLPLLLFAKTAAREYSGLRVPGPGMADEKSEKLDTSVAFLKFDIDGEPAQKWNYMAPGTAYDLTIEVRVSNWPPNARKLTLVPIAVEVLEQGWLPEFSFSKPTGDGPYTLTGTKRAVLQVAQSFGSRPYEFKYAAEFDDTSHCREVAIVGHRQLRLEGTDISSNPLTGFSNVDRHLVQLRDRLRTFPGLNPTDLANTMVVLGGLGNLAAQALRQGMFAANTSESSFQEKVTELLRNRPGIGEKLQGHPEAAGGITDLTFEDVPIELKVENSKVLYPKDFEKYFDQTAAYALGLGKKIGVLCVLESTEKDAPVGAPEDDINTFVHPTGQSSTAIVVVVVRGGFPKPSAYSKAGGKRTKSAS
jgi:hypothetical protein